MALAAVAVGLLGVLSAGCSRSGGPADEAIAPGSAASGPAAPTAGTAQPTATPTGAPPTAPDGSVASGPGVAASGSGSSGSGSSAPALSASGSSASGSGTGGTAPPRAATPTPAAAAPEAGGAAGVPTALPSAVFVGEACAPDQNTGPAPAVNGLTLFCIPDTSGVSAGGLGRWATQPPVATQASPQVGGTCQQADMGRLVRDPSGRPLSCLRDPNGALSWSDVS
ncbi:hypothetical protein [Frankia sp. AgB32]|uniref:hypothetical protein n=1 Tax=Frankia sp. AgB32 TaxID=631119 RepID=UPI00200D2C0F|nr:hypothetical protein [Frankia sp. AgB32]MCK9894354.1 hypothetical protein [Frankia sp. AgB32]